MFGSVIPKKQNRWELWNNKIARSYWEYLFN